MEKGRFSFENDTTAIFKEAEEKLNIVRKDYQSIKQSIVKEKSDLMKQIDISHAKQIVKGNHSKKMDFVCDLVRLGIKSLENEKK